jgi:hypothetical protein
MQGKSCLRLPGGGFSRRSSFLKEWCPDVNLRNEVERLPAEHDQAGAFLSTPALGNVGPGGRGEPAETETSRR